MIHDDPVLEQDPRLVEFCLNCQRYKCIGVCDEYAKYKREISPRTKRPARGKLWEMDGRKMTLSQWADEYGISERTLRKRTETGMSINDALTMQPYKRVQRYTAFGRTQPLYDWSEEYGIKTGTLISRMKKGMTLEQALKAPIAGKVLKDDRQR